MGKLYQRADRVVAWIGRKEQETSPEASPKDAAEAGASMELLKEEAHITREEQYHLGPAKSKESEYLSPDYFLVEHLAKSLKAARWHPLVDFCSRTYWNRLWIIQEIVLASEIHIQCGDIQLEWTVLGKAFASYARLEDYLTPHPNGHIEVSHQCIGGTVPFKINQQRLARMAPGYLRNALFDLFHTYQRAECADLRDKVFGLLGMSQACCQKAITVNYQSSPLELCELLLRHHLVYHRREISNSRLFWAQVRQTFPLLRAWYPHSDIRSMSEITWLNQPTLANVWLDPDMTRLMRADIVDFCLKFQSIKTLNRVLSPISDKSICILWRETMLRTKGLRHPHSLLKVAGAGQPMAHCKSGIWRTS
jgi:hypothetical protein